MDRTELELRQIARELASSLVEIVRGDVALAERITQALDKAFLRPPGLVASGLQAALGIDPRVHEWALARLGRVPHLVERHGRPRGEEIRDEDPATAKPEYPPPVTPPAAPRPRYLHTEMVERVETGRPLSLFVSIERTPREGVPTALKAFDMPSAGATVTVVVSSAGLVRQGDMEADIEVPADGDSEPHRFAFTAGAPGLHTVKVEVYRGGTFLGKVLLEVSVLLSVDGTAGADRRVRCAELSSVAFEPGEVTLQVRRSPEGYSFQLFGTALYPGVTAVMGDPATVVAQIAAELKSMAADKSEFTSTAEVRERLRSLGVELWTTAVPKAVQEQFWHTIDRIKMFSIADDRSTIPWELLYPMKVGGAYDGFLADRFPVVRREFEAERIGVLPMGSAGYVVPPGSPADADDEVAAIRARLGSRVTDRGVASSRSAVRQLVDDSPGIMHLACHNSFSEADGSVITLADGPWRPSDLATAVAQRSMAAAGPLVFLNACRSAGEVPRFLETSGWAGRFMQAGAGAFIGSLWSVRSSSARRFAEAFYEQFVDNGELLGQSSLLARQAIAEDGGDPTWLAYTVYGNPAATAVREERARPSQDRSS